MSEKDPSLLLEDILECCDRIIKNLQVVSREQFDLDINLQDAVIRRFEIIGEAAKRLPKSVRDQYPEIPWKLVMGFRDVLIHDYPDIVMSEVYRTGTQELPEFREQIRHILESLK